jgi:imidazolonepropionase-like amidohydrolase
MLRLAILALAVATLLGLATTVQAGDLAIVGARVYVSPTAAPMDAATVLVHDGRITAVGPATKLKIPNGASVIHGRGKIVTAGFWNSHVHIFTHELLHADQKSAAELDASLDAMLNRWGFTSIFDVASILDNTNLIRARIRSGELRGPTILTVGEPFFPLNGVPIYIRDFVASEHLVLPEVTSIQNGVDREKNQIARGADGVKLFTGDIVGGAVGVEIMSLPLAKALVAEAHRQHRPVFAHPTNQQGVEIALDSGVDILAHTATQGTAWSPALIARMKAGRMALIPTLTLVDVEMRKAGASAADTAALESLVQGQLRAYHQAGGEVLFGTDVGYTDAFDTTREYQLMAGAGLDWRAILESLTTAPSRRFGYGDHKGAVAVGMDADLVVLDADPASDVAAFAQVRDTISKGRVIYSADR